MPYTKRIKFSSGSIKTFHFFNREIFGWNKVEEFIPNENEVDEIITYESNKKGNIVDLLDVKSLFKGSDKNLPFKDKWTGFICDNMKLFDYNFLEFKCNSNNEGVHNVIRFDFDDGTIVSIDLDNNEEFIECRYSVILNF